MGANLSSISNKHESGDRRDSQYTDLSSFELESKDSLKFGSEVEIGSSFEDREIDWRINLDILVIGASGSGKTSLIRRFVSNEFERKHIETYHSQASKTLKIQGKINKDLFFVEV